MITYCLLGTVLSALCVLFPKLNNCEMSMFFFNVFKYGFSRLAKTSRSQ